MDELFTVDDDDGWEEDETLLGKGPTYCFLSQHAQIQMWHVCMARGHRDQNAGPVPGLVSLATGHEKKEWTPLGHGLKTSTWGY